ncbi:hypothetical protein BJY01DRAFT_205494 [Aspergillus pseudoustus]|uniref:Uncharacterized protein n=1 Tax=Aspergillus pseudoustus TaxID=1810923 RepID=A0ABR4KQ20_9EURO
MKGSLDPAYLLYLRSGNSRGLPFATRISCSRSPQIHPGRGSQWKRSFSARVKSPVIDLDILEKYYRLGIGRSPDIPPWERKSPRAWTSLLDQYLPPSFQNGFEDTTSHSTPKHPSGLTQQSFIQAVELAHFLFHARTNLDLDLLAHLGFKSNNWTAVGTLLGKLLDTAEALEEVSALPQRSFINYLASSSRLSLDKLTGQRLSSFSRLSAKNNNAPPASEFTSLDALTRMPFAQYHHRRLMAEVLKSLGAIVLTAADSSPNESKLAMSYVYRILARLHHSGAIPEGVYRYIDPDKYQNTYRPPGMQLLSVQILDILSNEAWMMHQAEVTAKAAAAGQDSPFLSLKPNLKELGHEIWIEFILWCCVEGGHIEEGIWLLEQMNTRRGEMSWKFQDWKHLLQNPGSLRKIKIDQEVSWNHETGSAAVAPWRRKRSELPPTFHGLGKRVISKEIVSSLLDNISNVIYLGLGSRGLRVGSLIRHINRLRSAISPSSQGSNILPTIKENNWLTVRVMESGGLDPKADPQAFDDLLRLTHCLVPPWSSDMCPVDESSLSQFRPAQLYDDTSAFAGLIEYNLRYLCSQRLLGDASNMFAMLQEVTDSSKIRRIDEFFSARMAYSDELSEYEDHFPPLLRTFESSIPHISMVTLAELLDLITTCRAFKFGEWLLFSDDIDGPAVPAGAYGDQALAPSILRFAAATKNSDLGELVITSLQSPLSLNTLRALCNYRIMMHQWDLVIPLLKYMRDYRLMSWAHSNIATLAAEIIRLEHTPKKQNADVEVDLSQAKEILHRILGGEFHEKPHSRRRPQFQNRVLLSFTLLFSHISSPSLREIAEHIRDDRLVSRSNQMYIPPAPFHAILSAVVQTQGSPAGQNLYKRFCVNLEPPSIRRIREGGISHLYQRSERNRRKGDPHFDFEYNTHLRKKMVFPNPNTVRIITQEALKEYERACITENKAIGTTLLESEMVMETGPDYIVPPQQPDSLDLPHLTTSSNPESNTWTKPATRKAQVEAILFSCIQRFGSMGMSDREITREVGGLVYWKYKQVEQERDNDTTGVEKRRPRVRRRIDHATLALHSV